MASNSNSMVDRQLSHRTIREFTDQPVDGQTLATIYEVAMRTASSRGMQQASIIRVTDPQLKPRMPREFRVMENGHQTRENLTADLADYDAEMQTYYDLRNANQRVDSFTNQVLKNFPFTRDGNDDSLQAARWQGFIV